MTEEKLKEPSLPALPVALKPQDRLQLEMVVLDEDPLDAREFLQRLGIVTGEGDEALALCKRWLRRIQGGERGNLRIRYDDKGPTMDLSQSSKERCCWMSPPERFDNERGWMTAGFTWMIAVNRQRRRA